MFEPRHPFSAAVPSKSPGLLGRIGAHNPMVFTAWSGGNATHADDLENAPEARLDAYAEGVAAGHAAALAEQAEVKAIDEAAIAAMTDAVGPMLASRDAANAQILAAALARLLASIVGEIEIPVATLQDRAARLLAAIDAGATPTALVCHPADAARIGTSIAALPVQPDAAMARGSLRLATSTGWIDDSIADRLARIDAMLAACCPG